MKKLSLKLMAITFALGTLVYPVTTAAVYDGGEEGSIGTRVTVSKNNSDWYNYSNTNSETDGQTLVVSPGDTLYFKGEVWNPGEVEVDPAIDPLLIAIIKNAKYLEDINIFEDSDDDLDGDGIYYIALPGGPEPTDEYTAFGIAFSEALPAAGALSEENLPQTGMMVAKVKADVPDGTVIEGIFAMADLQPGLNLTSPVIKRAFADEFSDAVELLPEKGAVRVLVTRPGTVLTLPQTGASINNSNSTLYGAFIVIGALVGLSTVKIKKVVKAKANK